MEKRRVVITGMGAVTPIGNTVEETWASIKAGKCGKPLDHIGTIGHRSQLLPLKNGAQDLREAQRRDGQIVTLETKDRKSDQKSKESRHTARQDQGQDDAQDHGDRPSGTGGPENSAEKVYQGGLESTAPEQIVDLLLHGCGNCQDRIGIGAQQHKTRLAQ